MPNISNLSQRQPQLPETPNPKAAHTGSDTSGAMGAKSEQQNKYAHILHCPPISLSPAQVVYLSGSCRTIVFDRWLKSGSLPSYKEGGSRRILYKDLVAFLEKRAAGGEHSQSQIESKEGL